MLGKESVLARLRELALGHQSEGDPVRMSLVENTAAAVAAEFARNPLDAPWLQVVVREQHEMLHPLTRTAVRRQPTAILKQGKQPLAMLVGDLLIVSRTAPRCVRVPLIREARERLVDYELVGDRQLAKLAA
jgi:hypothetical protein